MLQGILEEMAVFLLELTAEAVGERSPLSSLGRLHVHYGLWW